MCSNHSGILLNSVSGVAQGWGPGFLSLFLNWIYHCQPSIDRNFRHRDHQLLYRHTRMANLEPIATFEKRHQLFEERSRHFSAVRQGGTAAYLVDTSEKSLMLVPRHPTAMAETNFSPPEREEIKNEDILFLSYCGRQWRWASAHQQLSVNVYTAMTTLG